MNTDVICFQVVEFIACNGKSDNNIPTNCDRKEVKLLNKEGKNIFGYIRIISFPQKKLLRN